MNRIKIWRVKDRPRVWLGEFYEIDGEKNILKDCAADTTPAGVFEKLPMSKGQHHFEYDIELKLPGSK